MSKLRKIKSRIKGVKKTQQITKTMEMVAAARIKKAQARMESARPYALKMIEIMESVAAAAGEIEHPLLEKREQKRVLAIAFTANRGLCGAFNSNIIRLTERLIQREEELGREVDLAVIGKKGLTYFNFKGREVSKYFEISDRVEYTETRAVTEYVINTYTNKTYDAVYLIFNHFKSLLRQIPTEFRLLPLEPRVSGEEEKSQFEFLWEPSAEAVLYELLPRYVDTLIFRAFLESAASEHAARRAAMKNATDNAGEMIKALTLSMNKARQAQITKELTEIVTSAEAIKYSEGK
jgi:F-type H+-transporting ATPase subunit gamma